MQFSSSGSSASDAKSGQIEVTRMPSILKLDTSSSVTDPAIDSNTEQTNASSKKNVSIEEGTLKGSCKK